MTRNEYWRLSSLYFFFYAILGVFVPYRSRYLTEQGFDSFTIGLSMSVMSVFTVISPLFWAYLVERFQLGKKVLIIGAFLTFFTLASIYYQTSVWPIILSTAAYSIAWNAINPFSEALTLKRVKQTNGDYNRIRLWGSIGYIVTVLSVGYSVQYFGVWTVVPVSLGTVVALIAVTFLLPDFSAEPRSASARQSFWQHAVKPPVALLFFICVLVFASHAPFHTFFDLYLRGNGYPASVSGWLITLGVVAEIVFFYFAKRVIANVKFRALMLGAISFAMLRWLMLAYWVDYWPALLFVQLLHAISFALMHSMAMHAVHHHFPSPLHGRAQALYGTLVYGVGGVSGNFLSGWLWQDGAGGRLTYLCAAAFCAVALVSAFLYRRQLSLS